MCQELFHVSSLRQYYEAEDNIFLILQRGSGSTEKLGERELVFECRQS